MAKVVLPLACGKVEEVGTQTKKDGRRKVEVGGAVPQACVGEPAAVDLRGGRERRDAFHALEVEGGLRCRTRGALRAGDNLIRAVVSSRWLAALHTAWRYVVYAQTGEGCCDAVVVRGE